MLCMGASSSIWSSALGDKSLLVVALQWMTLRKPKTTVFSFMSEQNWDLLLKYSPEHLLIIMHNSSKTHHMDMCGSTLRDPQWARFPESIQLLRLLPTSYAFLSLLETGLLYISRRPVTIYITQVGLDIMGILLPHCAQPFVLG